MSLKRRGKVWWVSFTTPSGERIRRSARTSNRTQAEEFHDRLKARYWEEDQLGKEPERSWQDAVLRWSTTAQEKASFKDDLGHLRWLDPHLGHLNLSEIKLEVIEQLIDLRQQGTRRVSNATVNRMLAVVRVILRAAHGQWGWLSSVPAIKQLPEPKRRVRWLTREEANRLLHELPGHLAEMMRFSLATGLRKGNVTGLEWSQIDLERRLCWIHGDQAKAGEAIGVPLNAEAVLVLRRQIGRHATRVFTYKGKPIQQVTTTAWYKALARAGIKDFRWHDLRHSWASWHVQSGTPLNVLQELGGWESAEMVRRYAHLGKDHLAAYADRLCPLQVIEGTNLAQPTDEEDKKKGAA